MCRDKEQGGRRCPHDGAEARRIRRQNAKLKTQYGDEVSPPSEPQFLDIESTEVSTVEKVKSLHAEYRVLHANCHMPQDENDHMNHKHPLTQAEIERERKLIELGESITELSYAYGAPTDDEWQAYHDSLPSLEDEFIDSLMEDTDELLDITGGEIAGAYTDHAPGMRRVKTVDENGNPTTEREDDFYINKASEFIYNGDLDTANRVVALIHSVSKKWHDWNTGAYDGGYNELIERRASAYRKALEEVGVEFAGTDDLDFKPARNKEASEKMRLAATMYPKSWVRNSNSIGELKLSVRAGRAYYSHSKGTIQFSPDTEQSVVTHELAHRLEYSNPEIGSAERAFLNRRSGLLAYNQGEAETYRAAQGVNANKEPCYSDNFADAYMGRNYDSGRTYMPGAGEEYTKGTAAYELLSMGMESVFYGKHGGGVGHNGTRKDPEYTNFVVGLLATSANY